MVISSKGRYALRVMVDLAEHGGDGYVSMRDVARRQEISDKYAGQIMTLLSRAGLVDGVTGKGGGYRVSSAAAHASRLSSSSSATAFQPSRSLAPI